MSTSPTMQPGRLRFLAIALLFRSCYLAAAADSPAPWTMTWSDKHYGPDGPWQAVSVGMGSESQPVALYPGGTWASLVFTESFCANTSISSVCYADRSGLFQTKNSKTWDNKSISLAPNGDTWSSLSMGYTDAVPVNALAKRAMDTMYLGGNKVAGVDLIAISQAYQTYPGGQNFPLEVGVLSLGCQFLNQTFDRDNGSSINATFINSFTFTTGMTASYSYGMHIGSASLGIKGSLLLGGYDGNRVVGDTSAQPYEGASFPINLLDIGIGVATGGSPWDYSSRTGLLGRSNTSLHSGITVKASLGDPYIYLPKSSCDAITTDLPTTYDSDLGLYLWNTSDPLYEKIITSPTYLSFEFSKNSLNNANITIKVPFALLNLTLEAPLVKTPTPYFPCMGTDSTPALGRAFFQAAFVGVNWGSRIGNWFLAQAPGPDYFPTAKVVSIEEDDLAISGTKSSWEATWASYWTPIAASPSSSSSSSSSSATAGATPSAEDRNGMSTGAKAGIAVGCAVGCILLIVLACLYFRRQRRARNASPTSKNIGPALSGFRVKHVEGVYELNEGSRPHELPGESNQPRELSNDAL